MGLITLDATGSSTAFTPSRRGRKAGGSEGSVCVAQGAKEEDVVKGLTTVDASGAAGIKEEEVRRMWERESGRVEREAKNRKERAEELARVEKQGF